MKIFTRALYGTIFLLPAAHAAPAPLKQGIQCAAYCYYRGANGMLGRARVKASARTRGQAWRTINRHCTQLNHFGQPTELQVHNPEFHAIYRPAEQEFFVANQENACEVVANDEGKARL